MVGVDRDADGAEAGGAVAGVWPQPLVFWAVAGGAVDHRDGAGVLAVGDVGGVDRVGGLVDRDPQGVGTPNGGVAGVMVAGVWPQPVVLAASQVAPLITYTLSPTNGAVSRS